MASAAGHRVQLGPAAPETVKVAGEPAAQTEEPPAPATAKPTAEQLAQEAKVKGIEDEIASLGRQRDANEAKSKGLDKEIADKAAEEQEAWKARDAVPEKAQPGKRRRLEIEARKLAGERGELEARKRGLQENYRKIVKDLERETTALKEAKKPPPILEAVGTAKQVKPTPAKGAVDTWAESQPNRTTQKPARALSGCAG